MTTDWRGRHCVIDMAFRPGRLPAHCSRTRKQRHTLKYSRRTCPLDSAASSGMAELRGSEADGMLMVGASKPGVGASALMRMKPVFSVLLMSTAAAFAAWALTTCRRPVHHG